MDALAERFSLLWEGAGEPAPPGPGKRRVGTLLARLSVVQAREGAAAALVGGRAAWQSRKRRSDGGESTEEAATATAGAGAAGPGASGVTGVVGVSGSGSGFGPPFLPDVWAAAAAAGQGRGPGSGLAPLPGLPPSAAAHGAALLSHWDPTLSSDWDGERTAPQCL